MKLRKKSYRAYERFVSASRDANLDIADLEQILEGRNDISPRPFLSFDAGRFKQLNPIPAEEVQRARTSWSGLIQEGYQGPQQEIEQLLSELEKMIQKTQ